MNLKIAAGVFALALVATPALAQNNTMGKSTMGAKGDSAAQDFVSSAGVAGMFEIYTSEVALKKSSNPDIKTFAQQMITDHTAAAKELKTTAHGEHLKLPGKLDDAHEALFKDLKTKAGPDFDKAYAADQVDAHDQAVALFSGYAQNGTDAPLKSFAAKTLPTLQQHQQHAKMLPTT